MPGAELQGVLGKGMGVEECGHGWGGGDDELGSSQPLTGSSPPDT